MTTPPQTATNEGLPAWTALLVACAVVATAHLLGVPWLAEHVLGMPAGIWVIGLGSALASAQLRRQIVEVVAGAIEFVDDRVSARHERTDAPAAAVQALGWWPNGAAAGVVVDVLTRVAGGIVRLAWLPILQGEAAVFGEQRGRFERLLERLPWPVRPLRVGLHMPEDEARAVMAAEPGLPVQWFRLEEWGDAQAACRGHLLDAVVQHQEGGPLRIVTLERPGHPASVVHWAPSDRGLTYADLFPARSDPAAVVIEGADRERIVTHARLVRAFIETAAALARSSHRLTLADRALGRAPADERDDGTPWPGVSPVSGSVNRLLAASGESAAAWPEAAALASRGASGFLAAGGDDAHPGSLHLIASREDGGLSPQIVDCPLLALRVGAACIASLDDDLGIDWIVRGESLLRASGDREASVDHGAFLESELSNGADDPASVGRAAAGLALICAATERDRLSFVRDDLSEEMAYAGWLVGRDQDRSLLTRVFREIERVYAPAPTASEEKASVRKTSKKRAAKKATAKKKSASGKTANRTAGTGRSASKKKASRGPTAGSIRKIGKQAARRRAA